MKLDTFFIQQIPDVYTAGDHDVWATLCARQRDALRGKATCRFYEGLEKIRLDFTRVPRLADTNEHMTPITGWTAAAVPGYIDARYFFQCLRQRLYPTTITLRRADSLDYIEEPDIFHDVFGHVALMTDPVYGTLMQHFGDIHDVITTDQDLVEMTRLFWFTIEFGLVYEEGGPRILCAGLLSSPGEAVRSLSSNVDRRPFRLADVIAQPFRIDVFQDILFVAESLDQLIDACRVLIYQIKERNAIRWSGQKVFAPQRLGIPSPEGIR